MRLCCCAGQSSPAPAPALHYAVVMDAGSSGTRVYLYSWPDHTGDRHQLLAISPLLRDGEPMVKKATPGLSSLGEKPENAFEYIRPLLSFASENIPRQKHKETPLYILATAGMRLLAQKQQDAVLTNLRRGIKENFEFYFPDGHLEIISGKQEGIYQWLSINYVLGKFEHAEHAAPNEELVEVEHKAGGRDGDSMVFRPRTVGALDMGGASMQLAMEITTNLQLEGMTEKDKAQVAEINLGCMEHDTEHTYRSLFLIIIQSVNKISFCQGVRYNVPRIWSERGPGPARANSLPGDSGGGRGDGSEQGGAAG